MNTNKITLFFKKAAIFLCMLLVASLFIPGEIVLGASISGQSSSFQMQGTITSPIQTAPRVESAPSVVVPSVVTPKRSSAPQIQKKVIPRKVATEAKKEAVVTIPAVVETPPVLETPMAVCTGIATLLVETKEKSLSLFDIIEKSLFTNSILLLIFFLGVVIVVLLLLILLLERRIAFAEQHLEKVPGFRSFFKNSKKK